MVLPVELDVVYTPEQRKEMRSMLCRPFDLKYVQWILVSKSKDGKTGYVAPYVKMQTYLDRLDEIFSPECWEPIFKTEAPIATNRIVKGQTITASKIIVTCSISIKGMGVKSSIGEGWSNDDNGATSAQAQSFKRACAMFGLGKYLKDIGTLIVDLNEKGYPKKYPVLPAFALPTTTAGKPVNTTTTTEKPHSDNTTCAPANKPVLVVPINDQAPQPQALALARLKSELGPSLVSDIEMYISNKFAQNEMSGTIESQTARVMEEAVHAIQSIRDMAEQVGEEAFCNLLEEHSVESLQAIPSIEHIAALNRALKKMALGKNNHNLRNK